MADDYSFKIYSGAHNGLVFELRNGTYSLGSGDDNDLIFDDTAMPLKAAVLELTNDGIGLKLLSEAKLNGEIVPVGQSVWITGQFLQLGDTLLCFRKAGIHGEWPQPRFLTTTLDQPPAETEAIEENAEGSAPEGEQAAAGSTGGDNTQQAQEQSTRLRVRTQLQRVLYYWPLAVGGLLLCGLLFLLIFGPSLFAVKEEDQDLEAVQQSLAQHSFEQVEAKTGDRGVLVTGWVPSRAEYARLSEALPQLHSFLTVQVEVRDDEIVGLERDFAALGFYVRAHYLEDKLIAVEGYFKDPYVQAEAFRAMESRYRGRLRGRIVYQPELSKTLGLKASERGISDLRLLYDQGEVFYTGKTTLEDDNDLEYIRHAAAEQLEIPLRLTKYDPKESAIIARFDGINVTETAQSENDMEAAEKARQQEAAIIRRSEAAALAEGGASGVESAARSGGDRGTGKGHEFSVKDIMGVTLKPMRFITLKNGRKYFEGGVLPNGYTVSKIDLDKVVIEKGQEVIELRITK